MQINNYGTYIKVNVMINIIILEILFINDNKS